MAKQLCPSCGKPYNGKKCGNCLYEHFTEEIAHGFHTHEGEPLVIEDTERKPIPAKDPFGCDRRPQSHRQYRKSRQAKKNPAGKVLGMVIAIIVLANVALGLFGSFAARGILSDSSRQTEETLGGYDTVLFSDEDVTITALDSELRAPGDGMSLAIRNDTDQNLGVYTQELMVNGYLLPDAGFYCDLPKHSTSVSTLYLDSQYLKYTGSDTVENMTFSLMFCDANDYTEVFEIGPMEAEAEEVSVAPSQEADSAELLYDRDGLMISYLGFTPDAYDGDSLNNLVFCLENTTDNEISVCTAACTVNGQEESGLSLYVEIPAHTKAIGRMYMNLEEEKTLEEIQNLSVSLQAYVPAEGIDGGLRAVDIGPLEIPIHGQ